MIENPARATKSMGAEHRRAPRKSPFHLGALFLLAAQWMTHTLGATMPTMDETLSVGGRIAVHRRAARMTQTELAAAIEPALGRRPVSVRSIRAYEQGARVPPLDLVPRIAAALRTTAGVLLGDRPTTVADDIARVAAAEGGVTELVQELGLARVLSEASRLV